MPGEKNVVNSSLVRPEKIFLSPSHIKLGLMKNFVKVMDKTGRGFEYLRNKEIRKWQSSELSGCCAGPVDFVQSYGMQYESENPLFGVPLGFFPRKSRRSVTNKVKDFTKTILVMEKRYQGKWTSSMLADYCWTLKRDVPEANYGWKSYASTF